MQDLDLHIVHLIHTGFDAPHILRKRVVDHVGCSIAVVNEQRQVGGLAEIGDTACFLDRSSCKLGLHELHISAIVSGLLGQVGTGDMRRWRAVLCGLEQGRLLPRLDRGARWGAVIAVSPVAADASQLWACVSWAGTATAIPVDVLGPCCLCLLPLGRGDAALDGEGGTVGAGHYAIIRSCVFAPMGHAGLPPSDAASQRTFLA